MDVITGIAIESYLTDEGNFIIGKRYFFKRFQPNFLKDDELVWSTTDEYQQDMSFTSEKHILKYFKEIE